MPVAIAHIRFRPFLTPRERALYHLAVTCSRTAEAFQQVGMAVAGATVALEDFTAALHNGGRSDV